VGKISKFKQIEDSHHYTKRVGIRCPKCSSSKVTKVSIDQDGMVSFKQKNLSFKCLDCGNTWSIISNM